MTDVHHAQLSPNSKDNYKQTQYTNIETIYNKENMILN